jgi:hypothetical protein
VGLAHARAGNFRRNRLRATSANLRATAESRRAILEGIFPAAGRLTFRCAASGTPAIYLSQVHCPSVIRTRAVPISTLWPAFVEWVVTNITSPKHERQHQQPRCPCDHHSQQEPLIGFHCRVPPLIFPHDLDGRPSPIPVRLAFLSTSFIGRQQQWHASAGQVGPTFEGAARKGAG